MWRPACSQSRRGLRARAKRPTDGHHERCDQLAIRNTDRHKPDVDIGLRTRIRSRGCASSSARGQVRFSSTSATPCPDPTHTAEDTVTGSALLQLGGKRQHIAGARRPERVADGDRAAVRIELLVGDLEAVELVGQLAQHAQRLG